MECRDFKINRKITRALVLLFISLVSAKAYAETVVVVPLVIEPAKSELQQRVITVEREGGDFDNLRDALNAMSAISAPEVSRFLILIGPGTFTFSRTLCLLYTSPSPRDRG